MNQHPETSLVGPQKLATQGLPGGSVAKTACSQSMGPRFDPWVGKIPWGQAWQPTPVLLSGGSHGQRSLVGYSPWCHAELDTTEATEHRRTLKGTDYFLGEKLRLGKSFT